MLGDLNVRANIVGESRANIVNEVKTGRAPGLDGFPLECLKKDGMTVLE